LYSQNLDCSNLEAGYKASLATWAALHEGVMWSKRDFVAVFVEGFEFRHFVEMPFAQRYMADATHSQLERSEIALRCLTK